MDTIKPRIKRTEPKGNQVTNGTFKIVYSEENLEDISLFWKKSSEDDFNEVALDNCGAGNNKECLIIDDLSNANGEEIDYYFKISDEINEVVSRKVNGVDVDTTSPEINVLSPLNIQYGNNVLFEVNVSEDVSLSYFDLNERSPRYRSLCRNCNSLDKVMTFSGGSHNIIFLALDKAGNSDADEIGFSVLD